MTPPEGEAALEEEAPVVFSAANLVAHPGAVVGDPDALVHLDWSAAWCPFDDRTGAAAQR